MNLDSAIFYTSDINRISDFYQNTLNLKLENRFGDNFVSFIFQNGCRLGIKNAVEDREKPGFQTIFIESKDIHKDYDSLKIKDIEFRKEIVEKDYGFEFSFLDPDGNKVLYIQRK